MRNNRGTWITNVPLRFHLGSSELTWKTERRKDTTLFIGMCRTGIALPHISLGDGWELTRRFLSLNGEAPQSVLAFLNAGGRFGLPSALQKLSFAREVRSVGRGEMMLEAFSTRDLHTIQDYLRRMLKSGKPALPRPWGDNPKRYEIAFGQSTFGAEARVIVSDIFPSMLATVQFKLAQGARFRNCARKDCKLPFEITSRHERRFCSQYCAHITSLRRRRREQRFQNEPSNR